MLLMACSLEETNFTSIVNFSFLLLLQCIIRYAFLQDLNLAKGLTEGCEGFEPPRPPP